MSVNKSNFALVLFMAVYHVNPGAPRIRAGSISYISRQIFQKFSNASANNDVSL